MPKINEAKVVILATHGFEQSELMVPQRKLKEAGAQVVVVSPESGQIRGWKDKDWGESVKVDKRLGEVSADEYDAIVLPGGQINPDLLRVNDQALQLIRDFLDSGKIVAAVCHAPWLLIEVDAVRDRQCTSYHSRKAVTRASAVQPPARRLDQARARTRDDPLRQERSTFVVLADAGIHPEVLLKMDPGLCGDDLEHVESDGRPPPQA
jgi:protease I